MKALTIKDIARLSGVGISTVSRAINDDPRINPKTKAHVMDVVQRYHYVPNDTARNLQATESNTVGILVRGMDNIFFQRMYHNFEDDFESQGYDCVTHAVDSDEVLMDTAMRLERERRLKGLIFLGGKLSPPYEPYKNLLVPLVCCTVAHDMEDPLKEFYTVSVDDEKEGFRATEYLISKGHRRIAIIAGLPGDRTVGGQRLKGYKAALKKHRISIDESLIQYMDPDIQEFSAENGYQSARSLLERTHDFTALFCISDVIAFGAGRALGEAGLSIPDDVSLMGFDGMWIGEYMLPALTTMAQPLDIMTRKAADMLIAQLTGEDKPVQVTYDALLIERNSVKAL
ncbi:MAG: LacI family DNA-binding transcriptional regulator [Lachnospiraceae bacterium]|nr:LacI family DNA-binding transcriptional regulator [Lachnospiraceae bacterium]